MRRINSVPAAFVLTIGLVASPQASVAKTPEGACNFGWNGSVVFTVARDFVQGCS